MKLAVLVGLFALSMWVPSAGAEPIDFSCDSTNYLGTHGGCGAVGFFSYANGNGRYSTSYIHLLSSQFPGETFTFAFTTGLFSSNSLLPSYSTAPGGRISLRGNEGDSLSGTIGITDIVCRTCQFVTLHFVGVRWTSLSSGVRSVLSSGSGLGGGTDVNFYHKPHVSASVDVDVHVTTVPEPAEMALFGSGLLVAGAVLKRKLKNF